MAARAPPHQNAPLERAAAATAAAAKVEALAAPTATPTAIALHAQAATQRLVTNAFPRKNRTAEAVRPPPNAPPAPAEVEIAATIMAKVAAVPTATQVGTATHARRAITKARPNVTPKNRTAEAVRPPPNAPPAPAEVATAAEAKAKALAAPTAIPTALVPRAQAATQRRVTNAFPRKNQTAEAVRPLLPAPRASVKMGDALARSPVVRSAPQATNVPPALAVAITAVEIWARQKAVLIANQTATVANVPTATSSAMACVSNEALRGHP